MNTMLKVAVVGCGGIGNAHCNAYTSMEGVELCYVIDLVEEKAKAMAEKYHCNWCTDLKDLGDDIDLVSVVTPPSGHYPLVKAALERGFHVFCEKPLTMDEAQGEELDRLAKEKNLQLGVGFKMRFEPIFQEAKKYIPLVGKLQSVVGTKEQAFNPRPGGEWVTRTGAMYELSIHDFDLISFLTGLRYQDVLYAKVGHRFGWEKEDCYNVVADLGEGVVGQFSGLYAKSSTFCFRDITFTFIGDNGYVRIERPDRIIIHTDEYRVVEVGAAEKSAFVQELEHFTGAIRGEWENTLTAEDANAVTRFINEAYRKGSSL